MRDAVVDGQLQHLRVDHQEAALVGRQPVEQRQDHGVDADRLARAGGAGDQQMRHARQVGDHRRAGDVSCRAPAAARRRWRGRPPPRTARAGSTVSRRGFGSSMPMALRPGTTATRADAALIERAMSSASPITRDDLVPRAGSNSNSVTTGPGWMSLTSPLTPKSAEHVSRACRAWLRSSAWWARTPALAAGGRFSMLSGGRL